MFYCKSFLLILCYSFLVMTSKSKFELIGKYEYDQSYFSSLASQVYLLFYEYFPNFICFVGKCKLLLYASKYLKVKQ